MTIEELIVKKEEVMGLLDKIEDPLFLNFFDVESDELLDLKIRVMKEVVAGKPPAEIPDYYDALEKYPRDTTTHWDY